jgi:hypothetical protein
MAVTVIKKLSQVKVKSNLGVVKRMLHARIGGYEKPRSKKTIHASDLTYGEREFCPRQSRLMDLYDVQDKAAHISTAQATTFHEGRDKQARLNNDWLRDVMVGRWDCRSCGKSVPFGPVPKGGCNNPELRCNWGYEEVRVKDEITGASGGIDGLLILRKGEKLRLLECKIMDKDMFKKLVAPLAEHRVRTRMYLQLVARSDEPWATQIDTSEGTVLYIMRGFGCKDEEGEFSPFKEYTVKRNDDEVQPYLARAHAVTLSRNDKAKGFPCGICSTMMSDRAQTCPVAKQCFSSKHPPTITWDEEGIVKHLKDYVEWIVDGYECRPAQHK